MRVAQKASRIQALLDELYPEAPTPLDSVNNYTFLVAVLLSAQCTDARVNQISPTLFARASSPAQMVGLEVDEIREIIKPCGLSPTKARNIHALSEILLREHGGQVPEDMALMEALPGVGHKTASVVYSQAFGHPAFPVDTHIHRLATRWGLTRGKNVVQTEKDLKALFAPETWNRLHLQIIFFGREHCPALYHDLEGCPICAWAATKRQKEAERRRNLALRQARKKAAAAKKGH